MEKLNKSFGKPRIPSWVQLAFGVVIFGFLAHSLADGWRQLREVDWHFQPLPLMIAMACLVLYMICHALLWTWMIRRLGYRLSYQDGVRTYLVSQLAKYIPGGVWSFAALTASSQELGVSASLLSLIYIISLVLISWVSALFAFPILPVVFNQTPISIEIVLPLMFFISLIAVHLILKWLIRFIARWRHLSGTLTIERLTTFRVTAFLFIVVAALHLLPALSFFLFITSLVNISLSNAVFAVMAWSGSWFIGLVILIMPSGLGVREASLTLLLKPVIPLATATVLALGYRVFTIVLDALLLLLLFAILFVSSRKSVRPDNSMDAQSS